MGVGARDGRAAALARGYAALLVACAVSVALLAAPRTAEAATVPALVAAPALHVFSPPPLTTEPPAQSSNWSGYFASSMLPFTGVQGEWVQPTVTCPSPQAWTVFWVGLDGWTDGTVEQAGTAALCHENTSEPPVYFAWWEMFPTNTIQVAPLAIAPGDGIRASVTFIPSTGKFTMTVLDKLTKRHFTQISTCAVGLECLRSSAEWIFERPTLTGGQLSPLADWGALKLAALKAGNTTRLTTTGKEVVVQKPASVFPVTPVDMVGATSDTLASAGPFARNAFTDTWLAAE
jgi:hypothetical protein